MWVLRIRGYHPLRPAFPDPSASTHATTGLLRFRSPLLAESPLMSVPPGTEMFQFPGFASPPYVFRWRYPIRVGCPIRTPRDQRLLAASPGFSQRATSFIASWRQGIHPMPFSCSFPRAPTGARLNPSPAMHRNHPPLARQTTPGHGKALAQHTLKKRLERYDLISPWSQAPLAQHPAPRSDTQANPPRTTLAGSAQLLTQPNQTHRAVPRVQNAPEPDSQSTKNTPSRPQAPNPAQRR